MPRSEKKGATSAGDKKKITTTTVAPTGGESTESLEPRLSSKIITSNEGQQQGTIDVAGTAAEKSKKKKGKKNRRKAGKDSDDVSNKDKGDTIGGPSSNTAPKSLTTNRDALREDIMTQVPARSISSRS